MSQITTHILDISRGMPAADVSVGLFRQQEQVWSGIAEGITNKDGRISDLLAKDVVVPPGIYKLRFETRPYFDAGAVVSFYPFVEVVFYISGSEHYHVPLLLSPFGYSTYRGT
jgi:5-hydroxyisourate hydrolase